MQAVKAAHILASVAALTTRDHIFHGSVDNRHVPLVRLCVHPAIDIAPQVSAAFCRRMRKCISRESNPGHIDGNDVFYH